MVVIKRQLNSFLSFDVVGDKFLLLKSLSQAPTLVPVVFLSCMAMKAEKGKDKPHVFVKDVGDHVALSEEPKETETERRWFYEHR